MGALRLAALLALLLLAAPALAQSLTIAVQQGPTSLDPHYEGSTPNINALAHLYDCLVEEEAPGKLTPGLATAWRVVDDTRWAFTLRKGVTFHDGTSFTADDVLFSVERVRRLANAPNPFLPRDLAYVRILSRKLHDGADTKDFTEGRAAIGTGPYKLARFTPQSGLELTRNDAWFGTRQAWSRVTLREIPSPAARAAALVSGEVEVMERVAVADLAWIRRDARAALPAEQLNAPGSEGRAEDLPALKLDLEQARRLMAEAGHPDGFGITLHGTRGLYTNDAALLQALAQSLARIGIAVKVEALPQPVFITRANAHEFSLYMAAYNSTTAASTIRGLLMTRDPPQGFGTVNRMRYSNARLDDIMKRALTTLDATARGELLAAAQREAVSEMAVVPLIYSVHNWATRAGKARFQANALGRTRAMLVTP